MVYAYSIAATILISVPWQNRQRYTNIYIYMHVGKLEWQVRLFWAASTLLNRAHYCVMYFINKLAIVIFIFIFFPLQVEQRMNETNKENEMERERVEMSLV